MAVAGKFIHLDSATLTAMQTRWLAVLDGIAAAGQAYTIGGRSFTKANLTEVEDILAEISHAIAFRNGTLRTITYAKMDT